MAFKGLRFPGLQCVFGLLVFLVEPATTTAQIQPPQDPTRITEVPTAESKPCPHYPIEVAKVHHGQLYFPTPNSLKIGGTKKYPMAVQLMFDSRRFQNDSGTEPRFPDKKVLLYMDCEAQDNEPVPADVNDAIWYYSATMKISESAGTNPNESHFNVGSVRVKVSGDGTLLDFLKPYNGKEVILRLIEAPQDVTVLTNNTILKVALPDRK
jgi:hypothetical protein